MSWDYQVFSPSIRTVDTCSYVDVHIIMLSLQKHNSLSLYNTQLKTNCGAHLVSMNIVICDISFLSTFGQPLTTFPQGCRKLSNIVVTIFPPIHIIVTRLLQPCEVANWW